MRLAVFSGQYFWFDGRHYSTDEAFVKFVTSFHPYFEKIIFCDAVRDEEKRQAYTLDSENTEVCPFPNFTLYSFWKNVVVVFPRIYRIIRESIHKWDIVWLHSPHPVSLIFVYVCRREHIPFFFFVRQNLVAYVGCRNRGARRILGGWVAAILDGVFRLLSRKTLTFAVGREIYNRYRKTGKSVHEVAVSLVSERDIRRTAQMRIVRNGRPIKLLSVGRLSREKGIIYLIQAVNDLVANGNIEVILEVVGEGAEGERLRREVTRLGLDECVNFLGYMKYSEALLSVYRKCDIYILPSLTEGWPQTLFEAMACGVPVIATRVGGIPHLIDHGENGLLVNPGSSKEICDGVRQLMNNSVLRDQLIKKGFDTVIGHTLDMERDRIIGHIEDDCSKRA